MKKVTYFLCLILLLPLLLPNGVGANVDSEKNNDIPLVFIHGYNSDPSAWEDTEFSDEMESRLGRSNVYYVDYGEDSRNDITSDDVQHAFLTEIAKAVEKSPSGQIDVVAHSMGGLGLRWFLQTNPEYVDKIRHVEFIATPHHGSQIAFVNRFVSIFNKPDLYYNMNGQKVDEYLEEYIGYYQEYVDGVYNQNSKPEKYIKWLSEHHPEVLQKVKDREREEITVPGDDNDKLGVKRNSSTEEYRYSGAFEEYSKIMFGRKLSLKDEKWYSDLSQFAPAATGGMEFFTNPRSKASAHNIVQDRLMSEHFHIFKGNAADGRRIKSNIIANPFVYKLNKGEYESRIKQFVGGQQIPIYTTLRGQHSGNYFDSDGYSSVGEAVYKLVAFSTSVMSNINVWEPEGHDGVVPLSSAQTAAVLFDVNKLYDQGSVSHSGLTQLTSVLNDMYDNPFTQERDYRMTYEIDENVSTNKSNPIILENSDFLQEKKQVMVEIKGNTPTVVRLVKPDKYGKYIGDYEEVSLVKGDYSGAKGYVMLTYDKAVADFLLFDFTNNFSTQDSPDFSVEVHGEPDDEMLEALEDNRTESSHTYQITPLDTNVDMGTVNHRFKVSNNYKDTDDSIADFRTEDFKVFEHKMERDGKRKAVYPFTVTLEETIQSKEEQNIVLALDYSGSMREGHALERSKNASEDYIANLSSVGTETFISVVGFSDDTQTLMDFTQNYRLASLSVHKDISGGTAIYDTVKYSVDKLRNREGKKDIILMTDGSDTNSSTTLEEAIDYANQYDIALYLVALGGDINSEALEELANGTGGSVFYTHNADQLDVIYENITTHKEYIFNLNYRKRTEFNNPFDFLFSKAFKMDSGEYVTYVGLTSDRSNDGMFLYDYTEDGLYNYTMNEVKNYMAKKFGVGEVEAEESEVIVEPAEKLMEDSGRMVKVLRSVLLW